MPDNREIVKAARALSRDPAATAHDLRGALKGMLSFYDETNATTFAVEDSCGCVWCDVGLAPEGGKHQTRRGDIPCKKNH